MASKRQMSIAPRTATTVWDVPRRPTGVAGVLEFWAWRCGICGETFENQPGRCGAGGGIGVPRIERGGAGDVSEAGGRHFGVYREVERAGHDARGAYGAGAFGRSERGCYLAGGCGGGLRC